MLAALRRRWRGYWRLCLVTMFALLLAGLLLAGGAEKLNAIRGVNMGIGLERGEVTKPYLFQPSGTKAFANNPIQDDNIFKNRSGWGLINFSLRDVGDIEQVDIEIESETQNSSEGNKTTKPYSEIHVYVFSSNSECIEDGLQGVVRCFLEIPITELIDTGHNRTAHHLSMITGTRDKHNRPLKYKTSARLMLSKGSVPPLQSGEWHALFTCGLSLRGRKRYPCVKTKVTLTTTRMPDMHMPIALSGLCVFFITLLMFCVAHLLHWLFRPSMKSMKDLVKHLSQEVDWPPICVWDDKWRDECRRSFGSTIGFENRWKAMFLTLGLAFSSYAGQLAIGESHIMQQTGDHDVCRFNEKCFYPSLFLGDWLPINTLLSHFSYLISAMYVASVVIWVNSRFAKQLCNNDEFEAMGLVILLEGLGSSYYHICPSLRTFQFDTAFMTPLAHLFTMVMFRVDPKTSLCSKKQNRYKRSPMQYLTTVLAPLWVFNSIGSWFDMKIERDPVIYGLFLFLMFRWNWYVLNFISTKDVLVYQPKTVYEVFKAFSATMPITMIALLLAVLCSLYEKTLVQNPVIGGTANLNLYSACLTMLYVVLRPMLTKMGKTMREAEDWNSAMNAVPISIKEAFSNCNLQICKLAIPFIFSFSVGFVGLYIFVTKKVNDLDNDPSVSRTKNQDCIPYTFFDVHDLWHILSALLLGEAARLLIAVNIFNGWVLEDIKVTVKPQAIYTFIGASGIKCRPEGIVQCVYPHKVSDRSNDGICEGDQISRIEATYTIRGPMTIDCDDDGIVSNVGEAREVVFKSMRRRGKIVKVEFDGREEPFGKEILKRANARGSEYKVKVEFNVRVSQIVSPCVDAHLDKAQESGLVYKVWVERNIFSVNASPDDKIVDLKKKICKANGDYVAEHLTLKATHTFKGETGIVCDGDGIVKHGILGDTPAEKHGIKAHDRIEHVGTDPFSEKRLSDAEKSKSCFDVTVWHKSGGQRLIDWYHPSKRLYMVLDMKEINKIKELDHQLIEKPLGQWPLEFRRLSYILRQLFVKLDFDCYGSLHYYELNAMLIWIQRFKDLPEEVWKDLKGYFVDANKDGNDALERTEWEAYVRQLNDDDEAKIKAFETIVSILNPYAVRELALQLMKQPPDRVPPLDRVRIPGLPQDWHVVRSASHPGQFEYMSDDGRRQADYANIPSLDQSQSPSRTLRYESPGRMGLLEMHPMTPSPQASRLRFAAFGLAQ